MSRDPTEPLEAAQRTNRVLAERVAELERQLKRFAQGAVAPASLGSSLVEREALMREAERIAHMGSWVWNVVTNEVTWSDELYRILGYEPTTEKASFEGFFARVHPDDLERVRGASERSIASGVNERVVFRVLRPGGVVRHVTSDAALLFDAEGKIQRAVGAVLDVTELRESALAQKRLADMLADAQRIGKMGSFEADVHDPHVHWSDEMYRVIDVDPSEPASIELFLQRLHDEDRARIRASVERSRRFGITQPTRARVLCRDGSLRHVDMMAKPTYDDAGNLLTIRGTVTDVTELVRLEAQFHQSQKMEAIGQLAGGLAHDFNNLLMVIIGNGELLMARQKSSEAREILDAATAASSLTSRLLTFSRQTAQPARVAQIAEDLDVSRKLIQRALGDRVVTRFDLDESLWPVRVDTGQIQQVLLNLALNARDAMPGGGTFTLTAQNRQQSSLEAQRRNIAPGEYVTLQVTDTGTGMDEATCARVFEPFFTTKPLGFGTGLGLAMVFGTMKQCGGSVEVHSTVGIGTTFTLWFPRAAEDPMQPASEEADARSGAGRVLLVEDNRAVAHVAKLILESVGYSVRVTHDPNEALRLWRAQPADVLVTDVEMPGMSGVRLREQLAQFQPELRTLFITGHTNEVLAAQPRSVALLKPFRRQELLQALDQLRSC